MRTFDSSWYLAVNPDVRASGINPLQHYQQTGWREGRDPASEFRRRLYLKNNPDVAAAGVDPLLHFLQFGRRRGGSPLRRSARPSSGFDAQYYLAANPDVAAAGVDPLHPFQRRRLARGTQSERLVRHAGYLAHYTDVRNAGINPLQHYELSGWLEGRDPSASFDTPQLSRRPTRRRRGACQSARPLPQQRHLRRSFDLRRRHLPLTGLARATNSWFWVRMILSENRLHFSRSCYMRARWLTNRSGKPRPSREMTASRVGEPVRRLRPLLPGQARGRGRRHDLFHRHRLPAARRQELPLPRLRQPHRARARLRAADRGQSCRAQLAAADLRLPPGRGRPRSLLVAPAGLGRSGERACGRMSRCARASSATRMRCPRTQLADHIVAWPGKWPKGAKSRQAVAGNRRHARRAPDEFPNPAFFFGTNCGTPRLLSAGRRPPCPPSPTPPLFRPRSEIPPESLVGAAFFGPVAFSTGPDDSPRIACNRTRGTPPRRRRVGLSEREQGVHDMANADYSPMHKQSRAPEYGSTRQTDTANEARQGVTGQGNVRACSLSASRRRGRRVRAHLRACSSPDAPSVPRLHGRVALQHVDSVARIVHLENEKWRARCAPFSFSGVSS